MRTIKRNVIELSPNDEIVITGDPNAIRIAEGAPGLIPLTKKQLLKQLEEFTDETEIVVTLLLYGGDAVTYYLTEEVGSGWKPSGIAELTLGAFASG